MGPRRQGSTSGTAEILAGLIVAAGFSRAVFAAKGWTYYSHNLFFHAKIATFVVIGLLSVPPTLAYIRWRRAGITPTDAQVAGVRRWLWAEMVLFALLPAFAAAMARGYGEFHALGRWPRPRTFAGSRSALPEAYEDTHRRRPAFRVQARIFAMLGVTGNAALFTSPISAGTTSPWSSSTARTSSTSAAGHRRRPSQPTETYGHHGWTYLRLEAAIDETLLTTVLRLAWTHVAPQAVVSKSHRVTLFGE